MWGVCQQYLFRVETAASADQIQHCLTRPQADLVQPLTLVAAPTVLEPGSQFRLALGPFFVGSQVQDCDVGRMTWLQWGAIDGWMEWRWGNGWLQLRWEGMTYLPLQVIGGWVLHQVSLASAKP